jgi:UDPglucose 6-dehydrogenase
VDICVVGAGYVGLVTSACLAYLGNHVIAVDANEERLASLRAGRTPFFEPKLDEFLKETISSGFLEFSNSIEQAVIKSQVIFIAVGTPPMPNGESDLSQVMAVARAIGGALDSSKRRVIVNKSTVPVGSGNWVEMLVNQGVQSCNRCLHGRRALICHLFLLSVIQNFCVKAVPSPILFIPIALLSAHPTIMPSMS